MNANSDIEWTDTTWNPVRGCTKVSPGCANCYAETFAERWRGLKGHPYEHGFDLRLVPGQLTAPLRLALKREDCPRCMGSGSKNDHVSCGDCGGTGFVKRGRRIFVNSMSDLFQDGVPDAFIDQVFHVMQQAERHTFQVLTKRADRMLEYASGMAALSGQERGARVLTSAGWSTRASEVSGDGFPWPLPNVWLGVSVENQHFADQRIPPLLQTPAAVRFISAEPLLGPVDLQAIPIPGAAQRHYGLRGVAQPLSEKDTEADDWKYWTKREAKLDWVIVGGESGAGARPFDLAWARLIVQQCQAAGVPVFMKQLGARPIVIEGSLDAKLTQAQTHRVDDCGLVHLHSRKGGDMTEWPADLRVREFPGMQHNT